MIFPSPTWIVPPTKAIAFDWAGAGAGFWAKRDTFINSKLRSDK
jgi:hypothetical protein